MFAISQENEIVANTNALTQCAAELHRDQQLMQLGSFPGRRDYWINRVDNLVTIGLHPIALEHFEVLKFTSMVQRGTPLKVQEIFGEVTGWASDIELWSPVAGLVVEVNQAAEQDGSLIEHDPCGDGW